jgi:hypothetical protein
VPALFFSLHVAMDYSVGYEKLPWYPYSPHVTRGWLTSLPDGLKEGLLLVVLLCSNALLFWNRP